jgi:metal-responsive CopG/Arc/MetJ family transcriptional regulator
VHLPADLVQLLNDYVASIGVSRSGLVRYLVREHLRDYYTRINREPRGEKVHGYKESGKLVEGRR